MNGIRTSLNIPEKWAKLIIGEAAANDLSIPAFIWKIFMMGYEIYREEGL